MKFDSEPNGMKRLSPKMSFRIRKLHEIFMEARKVGRKYSSDELLVELNKRVFDQYKINSKTTLFKDMDFMRFELKAPIPSYRVRSRNAKYFYTEFFMLEDQYGLTEHERNLINGALDILSQMEGLPDVNLNSLLPLRDIVKNKEINRQIICYERNPSETYSNLVSSLFESILHKKVICFDCLSYRNPDSHNKTIVSPWQLKQYDERFYLVGWNHSFRRIDHFPVDRIEKLSEEKIRYKKCCVNLNDRFKDVVGVTLPYNGEILEILFWVSDLDAKYVMSRPLHVSQTVLPQEEEQILRQRYKVPEGGRFFYLHCANNYELKRELLGYLNGLVVLEPQTLRDDLKKIIDNMSKCYQ